ncbi:MAG: class I SAM-dependent methyltransferase [Salibacteraceae bacterium]
MTNNQDWFESWFDTEWYHTLYSDRDESEAQLFIRNLLTHLAPAGHAKILDLACGKGRHSLQINEMGFDVWGVDLSKQSIAEAAKQANENLNFAEHDMRKVFKPKHFDYILNLFTSFGYFNSNVDNLNVMQSVCEGLNDNGTFVLDFLNAKKVKSNLVNHEQVEKENITFSINRSIENNVIVKNIGFVDGGKSFQFEERVTAFELRDLKKLFEPYKLEIKEIFGSYNLDPFDELTSDRLILIAQKNQ